MDSYLDIARKVLSKARQPLSARDILKAAYQLQIVPRDLYGRTQHKTLQARLATDILHHRIRSEFYRTAPGRFFLRALQHDFTIPSGHRREYQAPLRAAQLGRFDVLTVSRTALGQLAGARAQWQISKLPNTLWHYRRLDEARGSLNHVILRLKVVLLFEGKVLLRHRKLTSHGDIPSTTSLGFEGFVRREDRSLFSEDDLGLIDAALRTLAESLNLPVEVLERLEPVRDPQDALVIFDEGKSPAVGDLMVIVTFDCSGAPEVLEATGRADLYQWKSIPMKANDLGRFDRWSARILADDALFNEILH